MINIKHKIIILTEGGKSVGLGHITRCLSIAQAFQEKKINVRLLINGDKSVSRFLERIGIDYVLIDWVKYSDGSRYLQGADILIFDSYLTDRRLYSELSQLATISVYIDDYMRIDYPSGIVVNGALYAPSLGYLNSKGKSYLLGTKYMPLRKEFWSRCGRKIRKTVKNVLVTFGGMDTGAFFADKTVDYLKTKFNFNFMSLTNRNPADASKMRDLILNADICISAGGQTTYELARCGIPTIGVCLADNQLLNLRSWAKAGFLDFVGWHNEKKILAKIENSLYRMVYEKRLAMSHSGKSIMSGNGARNIANQIIRCSVLASSPTL